MKGKILSTAVAVFRDERVNEEYVCAQQMEKDYSRLQDPDGRKISGLSTSF